jgi:hypothetical protein
VAHECLLIVCPTAGVGVNARTLAGSVLSRCGLAAHSRSEEVCRRGTLSRARSAIWRQLPEAQGDLSTSTRFRVALLMQPSRVVQQVSETAKRTAPARR